MKYFFRKHFLLFFTLVSLGSSGITFGMGFDNIKCFWNEKGYCISNSEEISKWFAFALMRQFVSTVAKVSLMSKTGESGYNSYEKKIFGFTVFNKEILFAGVEEGFIEGVSNVCASKNSRNRGHNGNYFNNDNSDDSDDNSESSDNGKKAMSKGTFSFTAPLGWSVVEGIVRGSLVEMIYQNLPLRKTLSEWSKRNLGIAHEPACMLAKGVIKGLIHTCWLNAKDKYKNMDNGEDFKWKWYQFGLFKLNYEV
ncbi:hypothetical protein KC460_04795 [Candidatus Dependentiae bacterium]|nr:hypothetical protein [Candidatus Dependentiae bacterium]